MTSDPEDHTRLLELPEQTRNHPLFRLGYNLGFSHGAGRQRPSEAEQNTRVHHDGPPQPTPFYGVTACGLRDRLVKGARIVRELPAASELDVTAETPCCGRRITIPVAVGHETGPAFCCSCGVLYSSAVAEEEPDGYSDEPLKVAVFVVEHVNVAVAQHRAGKWERRSRGAAGASA